MSIGRFFIARPIFAAVVSIVLVVVGGVSYFALPVTQYPEIAPPTIQVSATYPGASAETVADTVATPIEQEINGVEGMLYMLSQSTSDGRVTITVTFQLGTDLDQAQVLVQNRVSAAEPRLPEPVRRLGITTRKNSPDLMMVVHLVSPDESRDVLYISNYARTQIVDRLARIGGVGQATIFGERAYSMRIWLDPDRIAARRLTPDDVLGALRANNVQVAAGVLNQPPVSDPGAFQLSVETRGRLVDPEQFERIVVRTGEDGGQILIRDVARVELGAQSINTNGFLDGDVAVPIGIFQRPGSNALDTAATVRATMDELSETFPPGLEYTVIYNPTEFIAASIDAVYRTLIEAVVLVVLVILVFLQSIRAALIPVVAIPVSLIATFAVMSALGFSLNTLTLFGLVLAIGIVVDDAIIVVENVERYLQEGDEPAEAARKTMDEVSGALIATSLVLLAVFVPAAFIEGITGQFITQFAVTIATATAFSTLVSLTLSPALCAVLFTQRSDDEDEERGFLGRIWRFVTWPLRMGAKAFNWFFDKLSRGYAKLIRVTLAIIPLMLVGYGALLYLTYDRFQAAPQGFIPAQDQGYLITVVQLPPGASLARTEDVVLEVGERLRGIEGVAHSVGIAGLDGATFTSAPNAGVVFTVTAPFEERAEKGITNQKVIGQAFGQFAQMPQANIFVIEPPPVRGLGNGGGWKLYVQDRRGRGLEALEAAAGGLAGAANGIDGLSRVFTLFNTDTPKLFADVDLVKAQMLGVTPSQVSGTLETFIGSAFVNDFNFLGRTYRVTAQADWSFRNDPQDLLDLRIRSEGGQMVPIGSVAELKQTTGPYRVARYNLYPAASVQGATDAQTSTGMAIAEVERLIEETLPAGFGFEWTELALQESEAGNTAMIAFAMAVLFVFLVLAAQYESWMLPLAVILIVPMSLLASISGVLWGGGDVNILTQIGFLVLVGLACKNAILIVEFAKQAQERRGCSATSAAIEAARLRLRPIMMTAISFILGVVPLMLATGAGAEMRQALGTAVFWGMLGVTGFGLIFTPAFYVFCRWLGSKFSSNVTVDGADCEGAREAGEDGRDEDGTSPGWSYRTRPLAQPAPQGGGGSPWLDEALRKPRGE